VAVLAGAVGIAALTLFMLPALLGIGGGSSPSASPSGPPAATASASPTAPPAPTQQVYVIKTGDTLSKVARKFGLTLDELLAANPQIKDPNKIGLGQEIVIPLPASDEPTPEPSGSAPAP
jgi:LysM repeat protein